MKNLQNGELAEDFLYRIFFSGRESLEKTAKEIAPSLADYRRRQADGGQSSGRKKRPWLIEEEKHLRILELLREGRGKVWIARKLGVGVQTVQRRSEIVRRENDEEGDVDFQVKVATKRIEATECPKHGVVAVWPCVQCLAEEALERKLQMRREHMRKMGGR